jgi:hypothetical protein
MVIRSEEVVVYLKKHIKNASKANILELFSAVEKKKRSRFSNDT